MRWSISRLGLDEEGELNGRRSWAGCSASRAPRRDRRQRWHRWPEIRHRWPPETWVLYLSLTWMYQFLFLRLCRPNLSVISAAFIAFGRSCLLAKISSTWNRSKVVDAAQDVESLGAHRLPQLVLCEHPHQLVSCLSYSFPEKEKLSKPEMWFNTCTCHCCQRRRWVLGCFGSSGARVAWSCPRQKTYCVALLHNSVLFDETILSQVAISSNWPDRQRPTLWSWCSCIPQSPHWNLDKIQIYWKL